MYYYTAFIFQNILWFFLQPYLRYFVRFRVVGGAKLKKIPRASQCRGVIFAANHTSVFDTPMIAEIVPLFSRFSPFFVASRDKGFYGKKGIGTFFFGGLGSSLLGAIPLMTGTKSYAKALEKQVEILSKGRSLCYFPEGEINRTGGPISPKGGIGYLLWKSNAVLVPITIQGSYGMGFVKGVIGRKRNVTLVIGDPISKEDIFIKNKTPTIAECKAASQKIMDIINTKQTSFKYISD